MQCVHCGYAATSVLYNRHNEAQTEIKRRRECLKCGKRFTTKEQLYQTKPRTKEKT